MLLSAIAEMNYDAMKETEEKTQKKKKMMMMEEKKAAANDVSTVRQGRVWSGAAHDVHTDNLQTALWHLLVSSVGNIWSSLSQQDVQCLCDIITSSSSPPAAAAATFHSVIGEINTGLAISLHETSMRLLARADIYEHASMLPCLTSSILTVMAKLWQSSQHPAEVIEILESATSIATNAMSTTSSAAALSLSALQDQQQQLLDKISVFWKKTPFNTVKPGVSWVIFFCFF